MGISIQGSADDFQQGGGVIVLPQQSREHQREHDIRKLLHGKLLRESVGPNPGIPLQDKAQLIQNMPPGLLHFLFSIRLVPAHKAQRMQRKKAGVLLCALLHLPVHPDDAGLRILKYGAVLRAAKNLTPDAFNRGAHQLPFFSSL